MRGVKTAIAVKLPLLTGNPRQYPAFDCAEVGADQLWPGAAMIIARLQSPTTESGRGYSLRRADSCRSLTAAIAASRSSTTGRFRFCGWKSFAAPTAGCGTVETEGATHAIVVAGTGEQRINFFDSTLCATEPELERAPHCRLESSARSSCRSIALRSSFPVQPLLLQPLEQPRHLVDLLTAPPVISASSDRSPEPPPVLFDAQPQRIPGQH